MELGAGCVFRGVPRLAGGEPAVVYPGSAVFSFVTTIPPADWPVDDRSIFAFRFEALRRAMVEAKQTSRPR
jgi:hypothetical protein